MVQSRPPQHHWQLPPVPSLVTNALTELGRAATGFGSGLHAGLTVHQPHSKVSLRRAPGGETTLGMAGMATIDARAFPARPAQYTATIASAPVGGVTREELGRATWTLLHATAAQFPEKPTRRQQRDARKLIHALSRAYPCTECSKHFRQIIRHDPPVVSSGHDFQMWMCRFHNTVNKSIGKPTFNCDVVASRWGQMDCGDDNACTIQGR